MSASDSGPGLLSFYDAWAWAEAEKDAFYKAWEEAEKNQGDGLASKIQVDDGLASKTQDEGHGLASKIQVEGHGLASKIQVEGDGLASQIQADDGLASKIQGDDGLASGDGLDGLQSCFGQAHPGGVGQEPQAQGPPEGPAAKDVRRREEPERAVAAGGLQPYGSVWWEADQAVSNDESWHSHWWQWREEGACWQWTWSNDTNSWEWKWSKRAAERVFRNKYRTRRGNALRLREGLR